MYSFIGYDCLQNRPVSAGTTQSRLSDRALTYGFFPSLLFFIAFSLRLYFFSGFILGDDTEEFYLVESNAANNPNFKHHLQYRFAMWLFNVLLFKWLGPSEAAYFLPTLLMSASLSVVGYFLLLRCGYSRGETLLAGLFIATAPYEILIGTVRANDLILAWFLALALLAFMCFESYPVLQGIFLGFLLWLGFYTKLWAVYVLPTLGIYYLAQLLRQKEWRGLASFTLVSLLLHSATACFWKAKIGTFLPFLYFYSATYPVPTNKLIEVFMKYPWMIFYGSEFGTTLFGFIPYLLLLLLTVKIVFTLRCSISSISRSLDRLDIFLIIYYASFFLLLNFFPTNFKFDQYYSPQRIFRYLAPISFPITLHAAKIMLYIYKDGRIRSSTFQPYLATLLFIPFLISNIYQAAEATGPGRIYRQAILPIVADIKKECPPRLIAEAWLRFFLHKVYLRDSCAESAASFFTAFNVYHARDYERWLAKTQPTLPMGTLFITGLGGYVHYGCHECGFRLEKFSRSLDSNWRLVKEYNMLSYLPTPEKVRLWRLTGKPFPNNIATLFKMGMTHFDNHDYNVARMYYKKIIEDFSGSPRTVDALYFYSICYFREADWKKLSLNSRN